MHVRESPAKNFSNTRFRRMEHKLLDRVPHPDKDHDGQQQRQNDAKTAQHRALERTDSAFLFLSANLGLCVLIHLALVLFPFARLVQDKS